MADIKPNLEVERARIRMQIANHKATIERQRFEIIEMGDRRMRNEDNIAASLKAIEALEIALAKMTDTTKKGNSDG